MRILIAPDKFKGTLSAQQVAETYADGVRDALTNFNIPHTIDLCPISDGGEGFVSVLAAADPRAQIRASRVRGPAGRAVRAQWALTPDSAIIEIAQAAGLSLLPPQRRNPELASTRGVGQLIRRALRARKPSIIIGLGGSATCDGGVGVAAALGARFFDAANAQIRNPTGADLLRIARIDASRLDPRIRKTTFIAAADVDSPLFGPRGAAHVFAPQKGASPEQVDRLDDGLRNLARIIHQSGLPADPEAPGAGAAGGLGFALAAFCSARLTSGAAFVLGAVNFHARAADVDLLITGEGRFDASSLAGKSTFVAAQAARKAGAKKVYALAGAVDPGAEAALLERGGPFDLICPLDANGFATAITALLRSTPHTPSPKPAP